MKKQTNQTPETHDIITLSHLRWEFVTQRPQHILKRMSRDRKILFVEEPISFTDADHGTAQEIHISKNITVIQPRISFDEISTKLAKIVRKYARQLGMEEPDLWFYTPSFIEMADQVPHSKIIYDCMDELSHFKNASSTLISQEKTLLTLSDVVFTGGKSLYEAKQNLTDNVYCFPSSVDEKHFQPVTGTQRPKDMIAIPSPVVGFYGVIDERIDTDFLGKIAEKLPHVSFVMIGPVVKIDAATLPKSKNIYYLGGKNYAQLPEYLSHFDVAFMPFALNDSTKFISPTKTLEFIAAKKPIISTPITDVVRDYSDVAKIVATVDDCAKAITEHLSETLQQKSQRYALQQEILERTSWDKTVTAMKNILSELHEEKDVKIQNTFERSLFPTWAAA